MTGWGLQRAQQRRDLDAPTPEGSLAEILRGCASGDALAMRALSEWQNGRVGQSLMRMLGEPQQVQAARERLLADLAGGPGAFAGMGEAAAQDWLFARLRLAARYPQADVSPARKLYAVPNVPPTTEQATARHAVELDADEAPDLASARLRPASAPVLARPLTAVPAPLDAGGSRGGWLRTTLLLMLALLLGGGLAVLAVISYTTDPPTVLVATPIEPIPVVPPPMELTPAPAQTPPPVLSIREQVGQPIAAPEPPIAAAPMAPPTPPSGSSFVTKPTPVPQPAAQPIPVAPPAEQAGAGEPRIVVHHGGDEESTAVAQQLASQLLSAGFGIVEVRAVGFEVGTTSIRFFFDRDRAGADRLTTAIGPFLSFHGRAVPGTPIGFTDYRPLPRQGTLEIWLPRR